MERSSSSSSASRRSVLRAGALIVAAGAVAGAAIGTITGHPIIGLLIGLIVGLAVIVRIVRGAPGRVLSWVPSEIADERRFARLHNLVDGLCVANGLAVPRVEVTDSTSINAMVAGRDSRSGTLIVTSGLVNGLDRIEQEGIVAHLLSRLDSDDLGWQTVAAALFAGPLRPLCAVVQQRPEDRQLWTQADETAAQMTRYPPGLISALTKMAAGSTVVESARPSTDGLWLADPRRAPAEGSSGVHPPLADRIALLKEL